jgi:hypothetical protein
MNVSIHKDRAVIGRGCFLAGKEFLAVVLRTRNWAPLILSRIMAAAD